MQRTFERETRSLWRKRAGRETVRGVEQTMVECGRVVEADEVLRRQRKQVFAQQVRKSVGRQDFSLELQRVITVKHRARFSKLM